MRRFIQALNLFTLIPAAIVISGCQQVSSWGGSGPKIELFNGQDLTGWTLYVPDPKVDVSTVWSVKDGIIHCTGVPNGYMRTNESHENYHLHLEWRWPDKPANSGVLLHIQGEDKVWPVCIESQLMAGHAGDWVLINHTGITVDGEDKYDPNTQYVVIPKQHETTENPAGQWNTYDIICNGDMITSTVNGVLQNSGVKATVTSGPIGLQSEGGPIEFRNITLTPLK